MSTTTKKIGNYEVYEDLCVSMGEMSRIYGAKSVHSGRDVACRKIDKGALVRKMKTSALQREVAIMKEMEYKYILQYYDCMQSKTAIYVIIDYAIGNLHQRGTTYGFEPQLSRRLFCQLVLAVTYLHSNGICHRDINPKNVLLSPAMDIQLSGFGCATSIKNPVKIPTAKTTWMHYRAPELISPNPKFPQPQDRSDLWGLGVTLYFMESGVGPFDNDPTEVEHAVCRGHFKWLKGIVKEAKDLAAKLIITDSVRRMSLDDVLRHKYTAVDQRDVLSARGTKSKDSGRYHDGSDGDSDVTYFDLNSAARKGELVLQKVRVSNDPRENIHYRATEGPVTIPYDTQRGAHVTTVRTHLE